MSLEELEEKKRKNKQQRIEFIKYWVDYIKNHSDEEWSKQQNIIIDSQFTKKKNEEK